MYSREPELPILSLRFEDVYQFPGHLIANDRDNREKFDKSNGIIRDNTGPLFHPANRDYAGICQIHIYRLHPNLSHLHYPPVLKRGLLPHFVRWFSLKTSMAVPFIPVMPLSVHHADLLSQPQSGRLVGEELLAWWHWLVKGKTW